MTRIKQAIFDAILIAKTDRRVWAASGFVFTVTLVWFATGAWRALEDPPPEKLYPVLVKPEKIKDMVKGFSTQMREAKEENTFLHDAVTRMNNEISINKEEIDWNANALITRLNDVSEKVDQVANMVGQSAIQKAQLEDKIKKSKKKNRGKRQLDASDYRSW